MPSQRNGHPAAKSARPERSIALPRTIAAAIQQRSSSSQVAPGVERVNMLLCNAYLVGDVQRGEVSWALVDAGVPLGTRVIIAAAERRFGQTRPAAIILTHGHFDHVGGLPRLADYWDVPIYCHPLELPYVTGKSSYPPPDPAAGGGSMSWLSRFFPRGPVDFGQRVRALPADGTVPGLPAWRWLATPGHSPGHVSLWRESDRTLIAGDAFVNTRQESLLAVLAQKAKVCRPPAYFTPDWEAARRSVERLANLRPETAATGHGPAISGEPLRLGLADLLGRWEEAAKPHGGRYSDTAALTDAEGVTRVPPATKKQHLQTAASIGLIAIVAALLWRRRP